MPEFLLKPWAEGTHDKRVEVFRLDLTELRSSRRTPKYTGFENDLYALSLPVVAGMEKQAIETHLLRHIDNDAARVRQKLEISGLKSLTPYERSDWVRFLMSLRLRQPDMMGQLIRESADHLRKMLGAYPEQFEELSRGEDEPTLEDWVESRFPGLIENFGLSFFHELVGRPDVGEIIFRMRWWLWDFSNLNFDLLLADRPCILENGINDPNLVIALPISPDKAFLATRSDRAADHLRAQEPKFLARRLNEMSLAQAQTRIYARDKSPTRFIYNRWMKPRS